MKRFVFLALIAIAVAAAVFPQQTAAHNYTVQEVKGRVEREAGSQRVAVKAGDTLTAEAVIHTGVASSLVLRSGDRSFTIQAVRSGKVSELTAAASGIRIGGNITRVDTSQADRTTGQVSTASARASDAAEDEDIAAE